MTCVYEPFWMGLNDGLPLWPLGEGVPPSDESIEPPTEPPTESPPLPRLRAKAGGGVGGGLGSALG